MKLPQSKLDSAHLLCHHAFGGHHQPQLGVVRAKAAEVLVVGLELIGLEDGGVLFIGVVAVEPYGKRSDGIFRELDEILALHGGKIDRLPICWTCDEEGYGN